MLDEKELCDTQLISYLEENVDVDTLSNVEENVDTPVKNYWRETTQGLEVLPIDPDMSIAPNDDDDVALEIRVISKRSEGPQIENKEDQPLVLVKPPTLLCIFDKPYTGVEVKERSQIFYTANTFVLEDHDVTDSFVLEVSNELPILKEGVHAALPKYVDAPFVVDISKGEGITCNECLISTDGTRPPHEFDSIRALCGTDITLNCVHGSDSHKSASREIAFFFGTMFSPDHAVFPLFSVLAILILIWVEAADAKSKELHSNLRSLDVEHVRFSRIPAFTTAFLNRCATTGRKEYSIEQRHPIRIYLNYDVVEHSPDRDCQSVGDIVKVSVVSNHFVTLLRLAINLYLCHFSAIATWEPSKKFSVPTLQLAIPVENLQFLGTVGTIALR
ncbi:hypothetical protein Syun_004449 [Stephania yunnanensis]|uniref:Nucleoside diphosphate kinase-like domain-containing protein n=1 Tax=Stephania yunnanensis TaxID=152371 RepID=A0AAP0L4J9_9MAGN